MVLLEEALDVEQAVFDAEFAAIVLAEYPPGQGGRVSRRIPPRVHVRTGRADRPAPSGTGHRRDDRAPATAAARGGNRRRPGPGPRSPPPARIPRSPVGREEEVSGSQEASLTRV